MNKRLVVVCLVALILSACNNPNAVEPISTKQSVLDRLPSNPKYIEAYTSYSYDYTKDDVKLDITTTDTTFTFHPKWLEEPLVVDISDKDNIRINGVSMLWNPDYEEMPEREHTWRYSETDKHAYVAYRIRIPLTNANKSEICGELYHQVRKFLKKAYKNDDSIVLDTKTDFKRVIETDTQFADFTAKYCYTWFEWSDLWFHVISYYTAEQSSIDDFYYDD